MSVIIGTAAKVYRREGAPLQGHSHRLPYTAAPRQIVLEINKLHDTFMFRQHQALKDCERVISVQAIQASQQIWLKNVFTGVARRSTPMLTRIVSTTQAHQYFMRVKKVSTGQKFYI